MFGKPEICYLQNIVLYKDVFGFEVSMSDPVFDELTKSTQNLEEEFHGDLFCESARFEEVGSQGSALGQFQDNVEIVDSFVHVEELDNVGAFQLFVDLNFRVEGILVVFVFENLVFVDDLHSYLRLGLLLNSQVDLGEGPLPQLGSQENDVFAYSFLSVAHQLSNIYINFEVK